ncbi:V-type proton ATPase subunit E, putative [Plasmodium berghei]|uniref:V-type proton ATPase subunit E, putative n=2 Tax=Plasmodium berghei TaxID=5821 RepID=A0A509APA0_PLABA|nr:V-type proton ATPase subunit E, putative [Plasmodium berghei ANKA]CXI37161.1 V-type proton ATPase subunit E, putative [Plasmodium berghei]SCM21651.1 V-type proton ATPase subunit E, putative [Plasmodium berghei]SCN24850.1 V-type proton ATPase subunit E, putative [Plasmodium berghei]SCO59967.1 V-type proton ATPase subunit E, putative [Plasmodium berghei]SCO61348.1 V-type proton ATPase subunit E, putative [Plasmodium berghei]|eukprot:XP_034421327.1 V-type proton ATPase subunit E, putative [Plasmodium berghei ANKA]
MALDDAEAQKQIQQMVNFILNEAKDKAHEIEAKALEDFNIEKLRIVQKMKEKIRLEFQKKAKQMEIKRSINHSSAINKARLKKLCAKDQVFKEIYKISSDKLAELYKDKDKYKNLIIDLIVQALYYIQEPHVIVMYREVDKSVVDGCLSEAAHKYTEKIKKQFNITKNVKIELDKSGNYLPPPPSENNEGASCLGGIILTTPNRKINCDNTLDLRLKLAIKHCTTEIKRMFFEMD